MPDPATIARLANAFFAGAPSSPLPGPGAALPSAPVFAGRADLQFAARRAGAAAAAVAEPQSGAAAVSVSGVRRCAAVGPGVAVEPLIAQGTSTPTPAAIAPVATGCAGFAGRRRRRSAPLRSRRHPTLRAASRAKPISRRCHRRLVASCRWCQLRAGARRDRRRLARARARDRRTGPDEGFSLFDRGAAPQAGATPFALPGVGPRLHGAALPARDDARRARRPPSPACARSTRTRSGATSRSCDERVNGRPLVWLDNAATTQKPQRGDRPALATSTSTRTRTSTAPRTRSRRARPTPTRRARETVRRFLNAPSTERDRLRARHDRGHQPVAQSWGRRNVGKGDEIVITLARAPRQHRARGSSSAPRRARGCASRRSTTAARSSSRSTRSCSARARSSSRSRRSRTRSARSRRRAR